MVSLELEARLDNLLSTAQAETQNIDLFSPINLTEREECPLCLLPLPFDESETIFMRCCGKTICKGCVFRQLNINVENGKPTIDDYKCPFCQQTEPKNQVKALKRLMKKNNPRAFSLMAAKYKTGEEELFQSDTRSLEMFIKAAELGHAEAFGNIGSNYQDGTAVEQNMSKALEYYEIAAKKGSLIAHQHLAAFHSRNGNTQIVIKHSRTVASAGHQEAMNDLMKHYKDNLISKEDLTQTLRAYQTSSSEMKSTNRDDERAFNYAHPR